MNNEHNYGNPTMILAIGLASLLASTDGCGSEELNIDQATAIAEIRRLHGVVVDDDKEAGKRAVDASVTGAALPFVKELNGLQSLKLGGSGITDAGLKYIDGLSKLERLWLYDTKVTDLGFEHLRDLTAIRTLYVGFGGGADEGRIVQQPPRTRVTGSGLVYITSLKSLQTLEFVQTDLTGAGLQYLKGLTQLRTLNLTFNEVTDAGLENIKGLTQLETLCLQETRVSDSGLRNLRGLAQLRSLRLAYTQLTDAGLENIKNLRELRTLDLRSTKISDAGLPAPERDVADQFTRPRPDPRHGYGVSQSQRPIELGNA